MLYIGFLGQFQRMSSQFNHQALLFRAKSNTTEKVIRLRFMISQNVMLRHSIKQNNHSI